MLICSAESTRLAVGTILSMNILVYPSFEVINTVDCNSLILTLTYLNTTIPSSLTQITLFTSFSKQGQETGHNHLCIMEGFKY